jgi:lipid-A-disaccharide synthase
MKPKILLLAGEESGVLYAERLAERLRAAGADVRGYGDYGFRTADLAVMGFWPVLRRLPYFLGVARTMKRAIRDWRPDAVATVDYPGLNLKLAAFAKGLGIPSVHMVCPQVWAWHRGRIPKVAASLTKLLCFFPFEPQYFTPGFAHFVGHPLAESFERGAEEKNGRTLAVLPGSRVGEIEKILPLQLQAADMLGRSLAGRLEVVIPAANAKARHAIEEVVARHKGAIAVKVCEGGARALLCRADCATVASGTATLEAALARCPTVLVYKVGRLLGWFARLVIKGISHVGLANIIAERAGVRCPMPELLQEDFTAEALYLTLKPWMTDEKSRREAAERLEETMSLLECDADALGKIARMVLGKED